MRFCSALPVSLSYKTNTKINFYLKWDSQPLCSPGRISGRCSTQALAFPALAEAGAVSRLSSSVNSFQSFSLIQTSSLFWLQTFCHFFTHWKQPSNSAFLFQGFSIVLSELLRVWHVTSSPLSSGPLIQGIICHVELWNSSRLHMLVLGHPL